MSRVGATNFRKSKQEDSPEVFFSLLEKASRRFVDSLSKVKPALTRTHRVAPRRNLREIEKKSKSKVYTPGWTELEALSEKATSAGRKSEKFEVEN